MSITKALVTAMLEDEAAFESTRYLALFVDDPVTAAGDRQAATELSGGSYSRLAIAASEVAVANGVATVDAQSWFTANANVTGDPGFAVLCSGSSATGSPDTTVLWSVPLSPDIAEILNGTVVSVQANAIQFRGV